MSYFLPPPSPSISHSHATRKKNTLSHHSIFSKIAFQIKASQITFKPSNTINHKNLFASLITQKTQCHAKITKREKN